MSDPRGAAPARLPDRLVAAGGVLFLLGLVALVVQLVAAATGSPLPHWWVQLPYLLGVGFAVALAGLVLQARSRRRPPRAQR